jgi:undecaprenyl phosphate-alpha-L-ara4FN deformylase
MFPGNPDAGFPGPLRANRFMSFLALKVDVDTYRGTIEGVPRLLDLLAKPGIRATFFFTLGPDNTGKAIRRLFRKGFVRKVLSASPAASYGLKTMLYGTLLPAPDIGTRPDAVRRMREAAAAGHAVGLHGWDHVDWHDHLPEMSREEVEEAVAKGHARFREVFGRPAALSAAPGWTATPLSVEVQEDHGVVATSDTRGGEPFFPARSDGAPSKVLEIPSTLPTLDELLALPLPGAGSRVEKACEFLRTRVNVREKEAAGHAPAGPAREVAAGAFDVHSIHTEIEGGPAFSAPFARLLAGWKSDGVGFFTLEELSRTMLAVSASPDSARPPVKHLTFTTIPGRSTPVATGKEDL